MECRLHVGPPEDDLPARRRGGDRDDGEPSEPRDDGFRRGAEHGSCLASGHVCITEPGQSSAVDPRRRTASPSQQPHARKVACGLVVQAQFRRRLLDAYIAVGAPRLERLRIDEDLRERTGVADHAGGRHVTREDAPAGVVERDPGCLAGRREREDAVRSRFEPVRAGREATNQILARLPANASGLGLGRPEQTGRGDPACLRLADAEQAGCLVDSDELGLLPQDGRNLLRGDPDADTPTRTARDQATSGRLPFDAREAPPHRARGSGDPGIARRRRGEQRALPVGDHPVLDCVATHRRPHRGPENRGMFELRRPVLVSPAVRPRQSGPGPSIPRPGEPTVERRHELRRPGRQRAKRDFPDLRGGRGIPAWLEGG